MPGHWDWSLFKIDTAGVVEWSYTYGFSQIDQLTEVYAMPDSGFMLLGHGELPGSIPGGLWLAKVNKLGIPQWAKEIKHPAGGGSGNYLRILPNGNMLIAAAMLVDSSGTGFSGFAVIETDSLGNLIRNWAIDEFYIDQAYFVNKLPDGGYVAVGMTQSFPAGQGLLVRTDSTGLTGCNFGSFPTVDSAFVLNYSTAAISTVTGGTFSARSDIAVDLPYSDSLLCGTFCTLSSTAFPASDFNGFGVSCSESNNGMATVSVSGATAPLVYLWDDSLAQLTDTATGLGAGTYTVLIQDSAGCMDSATAILTAPPALSLSASSTPSGPTCDGIAYTTSSGGVPGYSYLWNTGAISDTITGLCTGIYCVTLTDLNGCMADTCTDLLVGTVDISLANEIRIYPNPTQNQSIFLETADPQRAAIRILDVSGNLVGEYGYLELPGRIELTDLPAGIYYLELKGKQLAYAKIVLME